MTHRDHPIADYIAALGTNGQLIDVREPDEVAAGSLPGAANIPLGELPNRLTEIDRDRRVVLFCRSGARSASAAEFLVEAGFSDVVNLQGGMIAWANHK